MVTCSLIELLGHILALGEWTRRFRAVYLRSGYMTYPTLYHGKVYYQKAPKNYVRLCLLHVQLQYPSVNRIPSKMKNYLFMLAQDNVTTTLPAIAQVD